MSEASSDAPTRDTQGRWKAQASPGRPWPKGRSGNPGGKPQGIVAALRELADDPERAREVLGIPDGWTAREAVARRLWDLALTGEGADALKAAQMLLDRLDGPVARRLEAHLDAREERTITVVHVGRSPEPAMPESVRELEAREERAEQERREREQGLLGEGGDERS